MISEGSLEPAAMVTVMCDPTFTSQGASDMVVGVASAFRSERMRMDGRLEEVFDAGAQGRV